MTEHGTPCDTREIRLLGELGRRFGRLHRLAVNTPAEAVRALCTVLPGFRDAVLDAEQHGVGFKVLVGDKEMAEPVVEAAMVSGMQTAYTIAPVLQGSKNALGTILTGAALIGLAALTGGAAAFGTLSGAWAAGLGATAGYFAANIGVGLVLAGLAMAVSPTPDAPKPGDREANKASDVFNGPVNTAAQGNPVPVCYGRLIVGSAVGSAGMSVGDVAA